jgi:uncharacterized protein (TIGR04222 family)
MIEEFVQIPGPTFLLLFAGLALATIAICWLWANADGSTKYPLPELTRLDSIAIAALRGGRALVIQTAVFRLWDRKLIDISGEGSNAEITIQGQSQQKPSGAVESEIYQFVQSPKKPGDIFRDAELRERIKEHLEPIQKELEQLHLARAKSDRMRVWMITALAYFILLSVGGNKLLLGIARGRPVIFLVLLLIASAIAVFIILKPTAIPTSLGRRYLKEMEQHFGWVKESVERYTHDSSGQVQVEKSVPEGIDPSLAVAIFGVGALAGYSIYQPYRDVFSPEKQGGSTWLGGIWYGGCGGWGGGCGGGGCGGGGCGGGGCGGCGG